MPKQYLSKAQIENMGVTLIKEFVEAGNTIVTSKDGADTLKKMDLLEEYQEKVQEMMLKASAKRIKKPKHKYPSNYTPSPKRHRKKK